MMFQLSNRFQRDQNGFPLAESSCLLYFLEVQVVIQNCEEVLWRKILLSLLLLLLLPKRMEYVVALLFAMHECLFLGVEGDGEMILVAYELVDVHEFLLAYHQKLLHTTLMIDVAVVLSVQKELVVVSYG